MARIVTPTNLEQYIDQIIEIQGSDLCWLVTGKTVPDNSIRTVEVIGTSPTCYDAIISSLSQLTTPKQKRKIQIFP